MSMGREKLLRLRNAPTAPAGDESLVDTLLGFLAGARVVVADQGISESALVEHWSRSSADPVEKDRAVFAEVLNAAMMGEREIRELGVSETLLPMVSDSVAVGAHYSANDGFIHIRQGRLWIEPSHRRAESERIMEPFGAAIESPTWLRDFAPYVADLRRTMRFVPLVLLRDGSYSLTQYAVYSTVCAAMTMAALTVLDAGKPFRAALARCKLPTCGQFYFARKNPAGGPANRTYCSPAHRDEHHNSAARKASARRPK
jgi:hypothetical protein